VRPKSAAVRVSCTEPPMPSASVAVRSISPGVMQTEEVGNRPPVLAGQHGRRIAEAERVDGDGRIAGLYIRRVAVGDTLAEMAIIGVGVERQRIAYLQRSAEGDEAEVVASRLRGGEDRPAALRQEFDRGRADRIDEVGGAGKGDMGGCRLVFAAEIGIELMDRARRVVAPALLVEGAAADIARDIARPSAVSTMPLRRPKEPPEISA